MRCRTWVVALVVLVSLSGCDDPAAIGGSGEGSARLRISPESAEIAGGDSVRFRVQMFGVPGVEWRVTQFWPAGIHGPVILDYAAMVGEDGWIRGLRAGEGLLIASSGYLADTADVRVVPGPPSSASFGWIGPNLWARRSYTLPASAHDPVGNRVEADLVWASETPERLAFTEAGTALALDSGTATFTVGLAGKEPTDTASVPIVPFSGEWRGFGLGAGTSALGVWCALDTGGRVSCGGPNEHGHLGFETRLDYLGSGGQYAIRRGAPFGYPVDTGVRFRSVELGFRHVCALGDDGLAYCWGERDVIGNQEGVEMCNGWPLVYCRFRPEPVSPDLVFNDITPSCGVTAAGDVWCWGEAPELVFSGSPLRTLEGGREEGCGLSDEGAAYCWGSNAHGQLGTGSVDTLPHADPVAVDTELRFTELSRFAGHACGLTAEGEVWCWGSGTFGELGTEETLEACSPAEPGGDPLPCATSPVRVSSDAPFTAVEAGWRYTCGVAGAGTVHCWGVNDYGQVAPDAPAPDECLDQPCSLLPQSVALDAAATSVTAGIYTTCAGMADGSFRCWGLIDAAFQPIDASAAP